MSDPTWGIIGPLLGGYVAVGGSLITFLIKRDSERERKLDALYDKLIGQVVPALERATSAAQGFPPILERNAAAMGAMIDATDDAKAATTQLLTWVAVLSDRQTRDPGQPRPPT